MTSTPQPDIREEQGIGPARDATGISARAVAELDQLRENPLLEDKLPTPGHVMWKLPEDGVAPISKRSPSANRYDVRVLDALVAGLPQLN